MSYRYVTTKEMIAKGDHAANLRSIEVLLEDLTLADRATQIVLAAAEELDRLRARVAELEAQVPVPSPACTLGIEWPNLLTLLYQAGAGEPVIETRMEAEGE